MRNKLLSALLLALCAPVAWAQGEKPLSQTEFVKYLYGLQGSAAKRDELVEILRKRGISFELTSGLRGLVRSKSKSDELLSRTLEEASRRRANPTASALPSERESAEVLAKAREATLAAVEEMPDFVVKQIVQRSSAYAGTGSWKPSDRLTIAVSFSAEKGEEYKVLAIDGNPIDAKEGRNYGGLKGATTAGEFVSNLSKIFKPESQTQFEVVDTDTVSGRRAIVFKYKIELENNKTGGVGYEYFVYESVPTGEQGKIWIDRENFRVLRIDLELTDIPPSFPVKKFEKVITYDWVNIAGQKYLLPFLSDARFTFVRDKNLIQTRNLLNFRNYQKYGSEVKILDDDEAVEEPQKP